jgi:peroxiredoxin
MKKEFIIGLCAACVAGCTAGSSYRVDGTWEGGDGNVVYLQKEIEKNKYEARDSTTVREGTFHFSGTLPGVERRTLATGSIRQEILLDEVPVNVTVTMRTNPKTGKQTPVMAVAGSEDQRVLETSKSLVMGKGFMTLGSMLMMMEVKDDSVKLDSVYRNSELIKQEFDRKIREFLDTTANSIAITYMIADFVVKEYPLAEVEHYYERLTPRVKASLPGKQLKEKIDALKQINPGGIAPEIALPAPDGTTLALSSLRGKYVLIDFWASWCGPCLAEVPNVKAIYDKYHDRGFEIFGVSLDDKSDKWTAAIERHGLNWLHVSSLKGWECPVAARYNVTGIPKMYLLDKEGRVIAIDLRGEALRERVASLFDGE